MRYNTWKYIRQYVLWDIQSVTVLIKCADEAIWLCHVRGESTGSAEEILGRERAFQRDPKVISSLIREILLKNS